MLKKLFKFVFLLIISLGVFIGLNINLVYASDNELFCFTAQEDNSTVKLTTNGTVDPIELVYSTDGNTWNDYTIDDTITLNNTGDKVYFRAKTVNSTFSGSYNSTTIILGDNYYQFVLTGKLSCSGNIQYLLDSTGQQTDVPDFCFHHLFYQCSSLTTSPNLPATTLGEFCYTAMFKECTSLIKTQSKLPAMFVNQHSYEEMFYGCTSLEYSPELPATNLNNQSYKQMFQFCTNLIEVPNLSATKLYIDTYSAMFLGCTRLTNIPKFQFDYIDYYACGVMFSMCSGLNFSTSQDEINRLLYKITIPTSIDPHNAFENYIYGTSGTITGDINVNTTYYQKDYVFRFHAKQPNSKVRLSKVGNPNSISLIYSTNDGVTWRDYSIGQDITLSNIGDIVHFKAKSSNNTFSIDSNNYYKFVLSGKLACHGDIRYLIDTKGKRNDVPSYCYYGLFKDCTNLVTVPEFLATTLNSHCYDSTFYGCTNIEDAPELSATILADYCYSNMFNGCSKLKATPDLSSENLATGCYSNMFKNCITISTLPQLNATILPNNCYESMFEGCKAIDVSDTNASGYTSPYNIPNSGSLSSYQSDSLNYMFKNTGGPTTFTDVGTPTITSNKATVYFYTGTYSITYNGNGSDDDSLAPTDSTLYSRGTDVTLKNEGSLTKTGEVFLSWNTNPDGSGITYYPNNTFKINSDTTLYAIWGTYTITTSNYTLGSNRNPIFICDGDYSLFLDVEIDNVPLTRGTHYTASSGSTHISIDYTYLEDNFDVGTHTIKLIYSNGQQPTASFEIKNSVSPNPGSGGSSHSGYSIPNTGIH